MSIVKKTADGKTERISEKELAAAIKMMKGTLESYAGFFKNRIKDKTLESQINFAEDEKGNLRKKAEDLFTKAAENLEQKYRELYADQTQDIDIEELLGNEIHKIDEEILQLRDYEDPYAQELIKVTQSEESNKFLYNFAHKGQIGMSEGLVDDFGNLHLDYDVIDPFSEQNFKETADSLSISETKVFEGIDKVVEFDPDHDTTFSFIQEREKNSDTLQFKYTEQELEDALKENERILKGIDNQIDDYNNRLKKIEEINEVPPNLKYTLEEYKNYKREVDLIGIDIKSMIERKKRVEYLINNIKLEQEKLENAPSAFESATELTKAHAAKFKRTKEVTVEDLYDSLCSLNEYNRNQQGNKGGEPGRIRGNIAHYRKKQLNGREIQVYGVEPGRASLFLYRTLGRVATEMNRIKEIKDPAKRKSQAIGLAAYAYQMLILEHVFGDANGRTCRMFMDTILQSFGMPPHIPNPDDKEMNIEFGASLNKNFAEHVFQGVVKASDLILKERAKQDEKKKNSEIKDKKRETQKHKEITTINALSQERLALLSKQIKRAHDIRGIKNSDYYDEFEAALTAKFEVGKLLHDGIKFNYDGIDLKHLSVKTKKMLVAAANGKELPKSLTIEQCVNLYDKIDFKTQRAAQAYIQYKYSDHTDDIKAEPKLKSLSKDDINKLKLIREVLGEDKYKVMKESYLTGSNRVIPANDPIALENGAKQNVNERISLSK